jgi:hypothetical protein
LSDSVLTLEAALQCFKFMCLVKPLLTYKLWTIHTRKQLIAFNFCQGFEKLFIDFICFRV